MFLKAGALSLALLLASRLMGLLRESAQAAAFGTSGMGDVAVLMLSLPDLLASVVASGALAYVLVPAWAGLERGQVARSQRIVSRWLLALGVLLGLALTAWRAPALRWLAPGLSPALAGPAATALVWSAAAWPLALLAALWGTRLQHDRNFLGLYGSNLVVNLVTIATLVAIALSGVQPVLALGLGLMAAMVLRLAWQWHFQHGGPADASATGDGPAVPLPRFSVWAWALLSAGLPLVLPFVARSLASAQGEGALATFNYAWKLVELPLVLAIQLVATLALPAVAAAVKRGLGSDEAREPVRVAFALAWALACAAAAGLLVGGDALAHLLFGWGRMDESSLVRIAQWGRAGAWGLLPQSITAVALTVLAARKRMAASASMYALALLVLLNLGRAGMRDGAMLMIALNAVQACIAAALLAALGREALRCIPWQAMAWPFGLLLVVEIGCRAGVVAGAFPVAAGLAMAALFGLAVLGVAWAGAGSLRAALRR